MVFGAWRESYISDFGISERSPPNLQNRPTHQQETLKPIGVSYAKRDMEELAGDSNCTCKGPEVGRRSGGLVRAKGTHSATYLTNGEERLRR